SSSGALGRRVRRERSSPIRASSSCSSAAACAEPLDAASRLLPVRLAQAPLEDLAALFARQLVVELDHARDLVVGDAFREEFSDSVSMEAEPRFRLHRGGKGFAEFLVGNTEHRA